MDEEVDSIGKQSLETKPPGKRGGPRPGSGRPKGSPNVLTRTIRECVKDAFAELGGSKWLVEIAKDDPRVFVALLGRAMPPPPREREEEDGLSRLTDEELVEKMEASVKSFREEGSFGSDPVARGFKAVLNHPQTLEEILDGSWDGDKRTIITVTTGVPRSVPEGGFPERIAPPVPAPVMPPLPAVKPAPVRQVPPPYTIPGQAAGKLQASREAPTDAPGRCIMREDDY